MTTYQLGYIIEAYPSLVFVPVGAKRHGFRSIGSKEDQANVTRLQHAATQAFNELTADEIELLTSFLKTDELRLPVPVLGNDEAFPTLVRPEQFLWEEMSAPIPIVQDSFYPKEYAKLSAIQLASHVKSVVKDFIFCAKLSKQSRETWLEQMREAFDQHPFIQLAQAKRPIVHAVEALNKSSLLGVLNYPEDISYWRHRVGVVMRPYRHITPEWRYTMCEHDKELATDNETLVCTCYECDYGITYDLDENRVYLPFEVDMPQAIKRIATIERQFNTIAEQSPKVITALRELRELHDFLKPYEEKLVTILTLQQEANTNSDHPAVVAYQAIDSIRLPNEEIEPTLVSLQHVYLPDVAVLKKVSTWLTLDERTLLEELEQVEDTLRKSVEANRPKPDDILFSRKGFSITRVEVESIQQLVSMEPMEISSYQLVQALKGNPSNKIRTLGLHQSALFGRLHDWPEKYITKLVQSIM
ncbi:hypothetical protein FLK61_41030 [Paenalkalicoccus suaedae]|uniref:RQC domain-containing protein n=1 Tax=Paenalkalicoccus suaedae TaxID=2592382 RepID=A0A859FJK2_9BACI|nr:RQC-minor-2 family DNA-binding protein [Paenalkalicoccus suaedae]QKS72983.1 hypothetical protein FLK61_41030 [Paenalkalicoccus suaedae]